MYDIVYDDIIASRNKIPITKLGLGVGLGILGLGAVGTAIAGIIHKTNKQ
jgi:hypothetical protein